MWFIRAGRGWGKTRTGAEWAIHRALLGPNRRIALVAKTFADGRDVMVEGESGLLSILEPAQLRGGSVDTAWNRSMGELFLANGSRFKIYSSEKPRQLRGPQHHDAWGDEPAEWEDAAKGTADDTTYSNLLMGLRLGKQIGHEPKLCLTGTPKNNRLVREISRAEGVVLVLGKTSENLHNLADTFRKNVISKYEGTRLGRQELDAELLEDVVGALWNQSMFEREGFRLLVPRLYQRVVIGVDPSNSNNENADEMGVIGAGLTFDDQVDVLADYTVKGSVLERTKAVVNAFHDLEADAIAVEVNNGGDWIPAAIRNVDKRAADACVMVHATRGKLVRAEPISQVYEQGRASHLGLFPELESELTGWVPGLSSPNRLDALVWAVWELLGEELEQTLNVPAPFTRAKFAYGG